MILKTVKEVQLIDIKNKENEKNEKKYKGRLKRMLDARESKREDHLAVTLGHQQLGEDVRRRCDSGMPAAT